MELFLTVPQTIEVMIASRLALLSLWITAHVLAQSFEVASIKPNAANDHRVQIGFQPGGRFVATGITVRLLIAQAFNIRDFQISGGPGWMASDRFDINAKAEAGTERIPPDKLRPMLKALLVERFQLKFRAETKESPTYALVAGKGGPKLTKSEIQGEGPRTQMRMGRGQVSAKGIPMAMFANQLSNHVGRHVEDKTGLAGNYDVDLTWTPEPGQGFGLFGGAAPPPPPNAVAGAGGDGPTIFTALQEQLGLKLESSRGQVPVVVIESISKPSEN